MPEPDSDVQELQEQILAIMAVLKKLTELSQKQSKPIDETRVAVRNLAALVPTQSIICSV